MQTLNIRVGRTDSTWRGLRTTKMTAGTRTTKDAVAGGKTAAPYSVSRTRRALARVVGTDVVGVDASLLGQGERQELEADDVHRGMARRYELDVAAELA